MIRKLKIAYSELCLESIVSYALFTSVPSLYNFEHRTFLIYCKYQTKQRSVKSLYKEASLC